MATAGKCPSCGTRLEADAPEGLCPRCLAEQGADILTTQPPQVFPGDTHVIPAAAEPGLRSSKGPEPRFGDYELLEEIAQGGMGVVYRARQVSLDRLVALKMILSGQLATPGEVHRFRTEAEAAAKLDHPNIVPIYEIGEHEGQQYFSMKLVEGGNLAEAIGGRPWPVRRAGACLVKIVRAVHYAHQHGILHRDLKPRNILLDAQGEPQLTDFGLAKFFTRGSELTQSTHVMGSANYMSPEQAAGRTKQITTATDVYGLGAILYEMLTGRAPFAGDGFVETLRQVVEQEPIRPSTLNRAVDRDLETICLKCLEKAPSQRYVSAELVAQDLDRWLKSEPILARPATTWEYALKWVKRKPAVAALAGALGLVAAAGLAGILWQWQSAESQADALRQNLYVADMNLAQRALADNNLGRALELVGRYFPKPGEQDLRGFEWRYLWRETRGDETATLPTPNFINSIALSPSGRWLAAGGHDEYIRIWDYATRQPIGKLPVPTRAMNTTLVWNGLQFSPDSKWLLARLGSMAWVFDTTTWRLATHLEKVTAPALFHPDGQTVLLCGDEQSQTGFARYQTANWQPAPDQTLLAPNLLQPCAVTPDGRFAAALSRSRRRIQLWDVAVGARRKEFDFEDHSGAGRSVACALAPNGRHLVFGTWAGEVRLWDCQQGQELPSLAAHQSPVYGLAFSPNSEILATAGHDQVIHLWDLDRQTRLATLRGHLNEVWCVAFAPDGLTLVTGGKDSLVKLWGVAPPPPPTTLTDTQPPLVFAADGHSLLAARPDQAVGIWDLSTRRGAQITLLANATLPARINCNAVTSDQSVLALGTADGYIHVFQAENPSGMRLTHTAGHPVRALVISPDRRLLASASPGSLRIWNLTTGHLEWELKEVSGPMAFSPDMRRLAAAGPDHSVGLWEVPGWRPVATMQGHRWTIWSLTFSPDSRRLLVTSMDALATLWRAEDGHFIARLFGHREGIPSGAFSPDGRTIATGSTDDTVKLWSGVTCQELITVTGFGGDLGSVLFSADGNTLAVTRLPDGSSPTSTRLVSVPALSEIDARQQALTRNP